MRNVWEREEVQFEGKATDRRVVAIKDKPTLDNESSRMDMGLHFLGAVDLFRSLQFYFGVEWSFR